MISYHSGWLSATSSEPAHTVEGSDVHGMMEVVHGVRERQLDLLLHSPGGSPQAAEQTIEYLRTRFDHIRAIVPLQAKSAATMMALGCDEIVLGAHSELGPIDPQIFVPVPEGQRFAPAHAILRDFKRAQEECSADVSKLAAWTPILRSYSGGLIEFCHQQVQLSIDIVSGWLNRYMLAAEGSGIPPENRAERALEIANYFGSEDSYERFRSHSRPVRIPELKALNLNVTPLEEDQQLQDAVLSVFHATQISLRGPILKIIENHLGKRFVQIGGTVQVVPNGPPKISPGAPAQPQQSRQERRAKARRK